MEVLENTKTLLNLSFCKELTLILLGMGDIPTFIFFSLCGRSFTLVGLS